MLKIFKIYTIIIYIFEFYFLNNFERMNSYL